MKCTWTEWYTKASRNKFAVKESKYPPPYTHRARCVVVESTYIYALCIFSLSKGKKISFSAYIKDFFTSLSIESIGMPSSVYALTKCFFRLEDRSADKLIFVAHPFERSFRNKSLNSLSANKNNLIVISSNICISISIITSPAIFIDA